MAVRSLAYIRIAAQDTAAWRSFGCDILGVALAHDEADRLDFRIDARPWRLRIEKSDRDGFAAAGFECANEADWAAVLKRVEAAGHKVTHHTTQEAAGRAASGLASFTDPSDNAIELVWGSRVSGTPFVSPQAVSGFVTGDGGMGHIVLPSSAFEETRAFYRDCLGFGMSDEMRVHFPDGPAAGLGLAFMHAAGPRHHAIAFGEFPAPSGAIHAMLEVQTIDDVGFALDRALDAGCHISSTLGRHTNDHMISFYVRTPAGFDMEYGCGGLLTEDWSRFTPTFTEKEDLWGHRWDFGQ
ncbi:VOC family protein [Croceicoccus sp. F390]|uniref:VOC family protein n=1 Tax=Croceicoccus esteveae TaxID=3075597 RepID=A0ABU2ZFH3_9SPHN|nr:VOC family protein [Croceicoccus sp. F390]MDT0575350.1 VOC family protein [Croceicoccus sp. F390]